MSTTQDELGPPTKAELLHDLEQTKAHFLEGAELLSRFAGHVAAASSANDVNDLLEIMFKLSDLVRRMYKDAVDQALASVAIVAFDVKLED